MTLEDLDWQAAAFADWYEKDPSGDWRRAFCRWSSTKDFHPIWEGEIEQRAEAELIARGILAPPPDYHGEAA